MLTIDVRTQIHRPAHEVFAFLADFTHMPLWNYYVRSVTQVTADPPGVGTVFDQVRKTDRQQYAIIEFMPDQQVAVRTLPPARPLTLRSRVAPDEQGAQVTETWELETGSTRAGGTSGPGPYAGGGRQESGCSHDVTGHGGSAIARWPQRALCVSRRHNHRD